MVDVQGRVRTGFEGVRDAFAANFESGADVGASAAVYVDGEAVVDIWGGHVDDEQVQPWQEDTIINVWSTTKTMTALCALLLADRGEIDLHAPVATYWPEFKAAGKESVEVAHLLGHAAGLPGWQEPMAGVDLYDWEKATSLLAAQEPWWEPGSAPGYHAISQGYLVGEVVRRVTGLSLGTFFAHELAAPLGADFHIGTGPEHDDRVAAVIPPPPLDAQGMALDPDSIAMRTLGNPPLDAAQSATVAWRRAEIPAAGGHGNARSVGLVQSVMACGGELGGRRFLSEAGCRAALEPVVSGTDLVLGIPVDYGTGYGISGGAMPFGPGGSTIFWGGWGGSLVIVDLDARAVITYVMNKMGLGTVGDNRGLAVVSAAYEALGRR